MTENLEYKKVNNFEELLALKSGEVVKLGAFGLAIYSGMNHEDMLFLHQNILGSKIELLSINGEFLGPQENGELSFPWRTDGALKHIKEFYHGTDEYAEEREKFLEKKIWRTLE